MPLRGYPDRHRGTEIEWGLVVPPGNMSRAELVQFVCDNDHDSLKTRFRNGGFLYNDIGNIETNTPEVTTGRAAATYDRAMEQHVLARLLQAGYRAEKPEYGTFHLIKNNIGYDTEDNGRQETTFGCHRNYLISNRFTHGDVIDAIHAYLTTSILVTGTGSVVADSKAPRGWRFEASQRARHIWRLIGEATRNRGYIKANVRPLADPEKYRRVEIVMRDTPVLFEPDAYQLDIDALVLLLLENGRLPRLGTEFLQLATPVQVLREISRGILDPDQGPHTAVKLADGSVSTALRVQLLYLDACQQIVTDFGLRHYQPALDYWFFVLHCLEYGWLDRLKGRVDWVTKWRRLQLLEQRHGSLTPQKAFFYDADYHTIYGGKGYPLALRKKTDPPGLEADVAAARHTAPPGRPQARVALMDLAWNQGVQLYMSWDRATFRLGNGTWNYALNLFEPGDNGETWLGGVSAQLRQAFAA